MLVCDVLRSRSQSRSWTLSGVPLDHFEDMAPSIAIARTAYRTDVTAYGESLWSWARSTLSPTIDGVIVLDATSPAPSNLLVRNQFYHDVTFVDYTPAMSVRDFMRANFFMLDDASIPCA